MKKIALIISMVALVSLQGFSQKGACSVGLKFGPTFDWSSSASTVVENHGFGIGFGLGGIVDFYCTKHIAISSGLNYTYWCGRYSFVDMRVATDFLEEAPINIDRRVRANYFEVPLKVKLKVDIVDGWRAFAEAGVGLSLNTSDKTKDEYTFYWVSYADSDYVTDYFYQYRWLQTALNFGLGVEYEINKNFSVFAQLSFHNALTNSFTRQIEKLTGSDLKTNFIGIEAGVMF